LELISRLGQTTIEKPLFLNCRHTAAFVVVRWVNDCLIRESEEVTLDAVRPAQPC